MFDRFTDRAKKVINLARQAAKEFQHEFVGTEHVLIGLVRARDGVACNVLLDMGADLARIEIEVKNIVKAGPIATTSKTPPPFTPRMNKCFELAFKEAGKMGHMYIGTEHLLLGLVIESEGIASVVLRNLGIEADAVRAQVLHFLGVNEKKQEPAMAEQWNEEVEKRLRSIVSPSEHRDMVVYPMHDHLAAALAELDRRGAEIERLSIQVEMARQGQRELQAERVGLGNEIERLRRERDAALNQSQAGARSELASEIERMRGERDFFKRKMEERAMAMPDAEEILRLRSALASVSGALADAGTVKVPEDESKLGDAVRKITAERDAAVLESAQRLVWWEEAKVELADTKEARDYWRIEGGQARVRLAAAALQGHLAGRNVAHEHWDHATTARIAVDYADATLAALSRGSAPAAEQLGQMDEYGLAAVEFAEAEKAVIDECGGRNRYGVLCELSRARDAARDRFRAAQAARAGFLCSRCGKATDSTRQTDDSDRPVCAACAQAARGKATIPLNQQDAPPAAQEPRWIDPAKGAASRLSCSKCGARVSYWKPVDLAAHERACWPAPAPAPQDASELALTEAVLNRLESRSRGPTCMDVQWTTLELPHEIAALVRAHRAREKEHVHSETKAPPAADTVDGGFDSRLRTDSAESTPGPGVSGAGHSHPAVPSAAEIAPEERAVLDAFKDTFVKSWFTGNFDTPEFRRAGIALGNWLAWAKRRAGEGVE